MLGEKLLNKQYGEKQFMSGGEKLWSGGVSRFSENTGFCIVVGNSHMINDEIKHFGGGNLYW